MKNEKILNVYVTNLGKYNEGVLMGKWLELPATDEKIKQTLKEIGINSEYTEYFVTDYESDLDLKCDEYVNIFKLSEKLQALVEAVESAGYDFCIVSDLSEIGEDLDEIIEHLENQDFTYYQGQSLLDVAYEIVDNCYDLPEVAQRYFDYEAFARDLELCDGYQEASNGVLAI